MNSTRREDMEPELFLSRYFATEKLILARFSNLCARVASSVLSVWDLSLLLGPLGQVYQY